MLRHKGEPFTPPHSLRKRQQQRYNQSSEAGPPSFDLRPNHVLSSCSNQMLDLSICHPSQASSNRFSVLATPSPMMFGSSSLTREFPVSSTRRTRNSRGTKEAKKRRDVRRNRRKLAAQLLDQQLSQAVDETLTKTNFAAPLRPLKDRLLPTQPARVSALSIAGSSLSQTVQLPPTPPELPLPIFSRFDLSAFPHFHALPTTPPPPRVPTPFRALPKWCPKIPSLTLGDVWRDSLPTFHDLSSLPEPAEDRSVPPRSAHGLCQDLQIWRPIGPGYGRDRSRFFPPRSLLTAEELGHGPSKSVTVKLPPSACRLHRTDSGVDSLTAVPNSIIARAAMAALAEVEDATLSGPPLCDSKQHLESGLLFKGSDDAVGCRSHSHSDAVAGPPEHTSVSTVQSNIDSGHATGKAFNSLDLFSSVVPPTLRHPQRWQDFAGCSVSHYTAAQPPYELDGRDTELPYVHANSLTGYSNSLNIADNLSSYKEQHFSADSGVDVLNDLLSEHRVDPTSSHSIVGPPNTRIAASVALPVSLPATPPATPPSEPVCDLATILPIDCITETEHRESDAHYYSEQALFVQTSPSALPSTKTLREDPTWSSINIADFLRLGHAKQCWCGPCTDQSSDTLRGGLGASSSSSVTLVDQGGADEEDRNMALSLFLDPSESEADTKSDIPDSFDVVDICASPLQYKDDGFQEIEDDGWLLYSAIVDKQLEDRLSSASPLYLPSSPVLHRQGQQRVAAPTVVITPSNMSAEQASDHSVAVATPSIVSHKAVGPAWHNIFPRRSHCA